MAKKLSADEKRIIEIEAELAELRKRKKEIEDEIYGRDVEVAETTITPSGIDSYKELMETIEDGVKYAALEYDRIKQHLLSLKIKSSDVSKEEALYAAVMGMRKCDWDEYQSEITQWAKANNLPKLASNVLDQYPEKRFEIQRRILAFMCEGKKLEDSHVR